MFNDHVYISMMIWSIHYLKRFVEKLSLGLTVSDSKGYNLGGSDLKNQLDKMKKKFRIKNNK